MKKIFIHILLLACCLGMTTCDPKFTWDDVLFTVEVQPDDAALGSVTGSGKYHYKEEITLTATANDDYIFAGWSDGNDDNPRKVIVSRDMTLTATFGIRITVRSNDTNMGTVSEGGTYYRDAEITLRATPRYGCEFVKWNDDNTNPSRTITTSQNQTFTAYFEKEESIKSENGHDYVDLGLSSGILWATCNVGANYPEAYGNYYAWGETTTKSIYDWSTYKYCNGSSSTLTKYCNDSQYGNNGFTDNKTVLDPADDAATANWDGAWRMPTFAEQQELLEECTWTWITFNGVEGFRVKGKNGNSIFLPFAGYRSGSELGFAGGKGYYWFSSLISIYPHYAYSLYLVSDYSICGKNSVGRSCGQSVRPVYSTASSGNPEPTTYTITVEVDATMGSVTGAGEYEEGSTATLTATPNDGYVFASWSDGNTDNPRTIVVTEDVTLTAFFEEIDFNGHEYVDLGLPSGTLWATCNVGATNPEDYGDYFAWGETSPKYGNYWWSSYTHCAGTNRTLTKYCYDANYGYNGFVDTKTVLDASDDVATINFGGDWRMPTATELDELYIKCTWEKTTKNGVTVYKGQGPNGQCVYIPAAGYYYGETSGAVGECGYYWSSSLATNEPLYAYYRCFYSGNQEWKDNSRRIGYSIRPVCSSR